jgi:alpha-ketoglutarate-dependent taurine dioxygenase
MPVRIEPLEGAIGALVHGLDSRRPLEPEDFATVEQAMFDHVAIVIPDLHENIPWLHDFGRRFGHLVPHVLDQYHHPETHEISIIARNDSTPQSRTTGKPAGAFWHSDLSYEAEPSDAIFLYAQQVPSQGGDTMVANMALAYEKLPHPPGGSRPSAQRPQDPVRQSRLYDEDQRPAEGRSRCPAGRSVRTRPATRIPVPPRLVEAHAAGPRQPLVDALRHRRLHRTAPHAADDRGDAQIAKYHDKGYVVPDYRLPEAQLQEIRDRHTALLQRHPEFRDNASVLLNYDLGFLNYARDPAILDMVEQVIGPDICLWNMSFFAKPALNGKKTPWHQDGQYWPIRPLATCTVWIAIDAATVENGCLRYIPGSHKTNRLMKHDQKNDPSYTLNQELRVGEYDESQAENLILEAGQMALHDVYIAHGSEQNRSPHPRRGMTMRMMPTTSIYDRTRASAMHAERGGLDLSHHSIFLLRGADRSGRNDFRLRSHGWNN